MNTFEKGYQAWKASKAAPAAQATKNSFELSNFDQKYLQWQYNTGRITEEQAVAQLNKPYTDFIGRVNGILSGYDQFAKNYTARFGSRKNDLTDAWVGNSQQYLADTQAYQANLISQTDAILKTLEANPDAFDKDTVDQIKSALHTVRINVENITKAAEQDNAYWSSWGTDEESKVDMLINALKSGYDFMPGNKDSYLTGEAAYTRAQQDQSYAKKYEGVSGVKLLDVINSVDDPAEKEWVTGQALRTMAFDEAQEYLQTMKQEYLELSQTGTLRNHAAAGMTMSEEEKAAAEAAVAQYEAVMKKYGIDITDENSEPMEELSNRIQTIQTMIAESERVQEHIKLSNVRENKDFEAYAKKGEAEAMEYAEKNKKTAHMTNKEIDVLAYYIAKDKENGTNLAEQYKESLMFYLKHRRAEEIADWVNDLPGVVKALTLPRITYAATAKTMNWGQDVLQNFSNRKLNQTVFQMADDYIGQDLSGAARIAHQTAGVVGYMAPSILASKFIGGATGVSSLGKAAGSALMFLGSSGQAYGQALEKGYDQPQARAYATLVGLSEVALQNVLGGISEFGGLPAKLEGKIAGIKNALLKSVAKFGSSIGGEIAEEELQNVLEPAFRSIILGEKYDMPTLQEAIDTAIVTALSTGGMEGPGIVKESIKDAKTQKLVGDQITQHSFLTSRERVVVNTITQKLVAEAEQGGKKLSQKGKQAIYDQVVEDMDTGRIDIQQIEEAIGKGTEYEQLVSEFEELKELNKMKPEEMTGDQLDRRDELRKKNLEIGDKYGYGYRGYEKYIESYDKAFPKAVEGLVNSDRLSESYRERDRRSEKYKVEDLSKYSEAQQQTIRDAMNSGILNNTRRTHEFVDFIAKVSEKLGVSFSFTDNQRLKESGFALNGVTVNGYVNKDGITINVNSAKALNRVVGHEITHILEGTDFYNDLAAAVTTYARTKGEYESRLKQIRELYKDKEGYTGEDAEAKLEAELVADLVGDYIFTDKAFVEKLFQEEPGLFKRIFEEIKYLCKLVTAGSKEAKQLEKAKKMFTEVVNEAKKEGVKNPTAEGGVKYSLGDVNYPRKTIDYKDTNARRIAEDETVNALVSRGKVTTITKDSIPAEISNVNWGDKGESRKAIKEILKDFLGEDVVFNLGKDSAIAYLTSKGIDHTLAGENTEEKAVALSAFYKLISNAEYSYSGLQDQHSKTVGREEWDYFVSVAEIEGGATVPLVFAVRSIDQDVRSQIYSIATKKNLAIPRGDGTQGNPANAHPSYGDSSSSNGIVEHNDKNVNNKNSKSTPGTTSLSAPGQVEAAGGGWDVRGQDVGLPMRSGYQESPVAVAESQQAQPVNLPGLEKSQPQSQGVTQEAGLPMPKQSQRTQSRGNAQADEVLPMPGDTVRAEQQRLDDEYRRQAGINEDPSLYDPDEDKGVETTRDRLEVKQKNLQWELQENQRGKETALQAKDQLITELQAKYDAKKHKDSKNSQALLRRIQRETRLKSDIAAEYDQKIARIQTRIGILEEKLQTSKPEKQDRLEQAYQKIDAQLDYDERELAKEYYAKRGELQKDLGTKDQNTWVGDKARDLLWEMANWEKGQRPSKLLGALWDTKYDWTALKHALADIKDGYTILPSPAENAVRDVLNRAYADRVQEMKDLDTRYEEDLELLRKEAQEQKDKAKLAESRRGIQQVYTAEVAELVGDTTTWKDKKLGISYQTNTLRRNLRYVVRDAFGKPDIQKADAIYDYLQGSYNRNEAELNRESARIKNPYGELEITKAEDTYIQMLGELRHNPDTELLPEQVEEFYQAHKDNIDKAKVDKVIDMARKTYDSLLIRLNEVLQAQGMKEIPYRKGYFPHFTEDKQGWFAKILNWKVNKNQLPTDIAGLTETYQPQRSWQRFNKQRMSDTTDYSFMKGMDNYVQGALDWIYHIEDIQKRRAFENYLRYIHSDKGVQKRIDEVFASHAYDATEAQEQIDLILKEKENPLNNFVTDLRTGTNLLAGKKHSKDRNMEMDMNREVYSTMTNISSRVSANMVAGSISSVMTNFIPITQSWSQVSPISSLKAMRQTLKSIRKEDGVVEKSAFLTNRLRQAEKLYQSGWDKASKAAGWLMEAVDSFTSQTVWRSKYMENIKAGMTEMEAILDADQFAENVMAGRSRGNMPTIFESKNLFTRMATAFQLEVANQYGYMFKDMPQDMKNAGIGKMVKGYAAMYIGAYAYNALFSMLTGRNSAFDPIRILQGFIGGLVSDDDEEKKPMDAFMKLAEDVLQEVPFVGGFLGGGRVPISSALPYDGNVMDILSGIGKMTEGDFSDFTSEWLNPVYYLLLPMGGGQIKKTNEAIAMYKDGFKMQLRDVPGSYTNSGELRFPTEKGVWPVIRNLIFGKWSGPNAKRYIEEGRSPLSEKQIEEYQDTGMDIQQYWDYLDGLKQLNKESDSGRASINDIGDYIGELDLTTEQKNILINNAAGRKEPIDMATYDEYPNFEEFDYGTQNPGKYAISQAVGGFEAFKEYQEDLKDLDKNETADYINELDIDYGMKIILYVSRYSSKASREEYGYDIVDYLNGRRDIDENQMRKILRELGFKVDWQGNVTWD